MITASTTLAAVLGDPIDHSLSPVLHNAGYRTLGLDWAYVAFRVGLGQVRDAVAGVRALGLAGVNVTMPLKVAAARLADRQSPEVSALGAANTLVNESGVLVARNTDIEGFARSLKDGLGLEPGGMRAAVLGAGGAARAVVAALGAGGAEKVVVMARRKSPAEAAAALAGRAGKAVPLRSAAARAAVDRAELVVNATPLGMRGEALPPELLARLVPEHAVMDLVYAPPETPLLSAARTVGARTLGGLGMLVHQAGLAFTLFTGQPAPLEDMSVAAISALSHDTAN